MTTEQMVCNMCESQTATMQCDTCGNVVMCNVCHTEGTNRGICKTCIMSNKDCHFCANNWLEGENDTTAVLAAVCKECRHGYCERCAFKNNEELKCPQCFDILEKQLKNQINENLNQIDTEYEKHRLQFISDMESQHKGVPKRRRRLPTALATPTIITHIPRPDNVGESDDSDDTKTPSWVSKFRYDEDEDEGEREYYNDISPLKLSPIHISDSVPKYTSKSHFHMVAASDILVCQIKNRLSNIYKIGDPQKFLDAVTNSKSILGGTFILDCILGEYHDDSSLEILGTLAGCARISLQIPTKCLISTVKQSSSVLAKVSQYIIGTNNIYMKSLKHIDDMDEYYSTCINTSLLQNKFDGNNFHIGNLDTLKKHGIMYKYDNLIAKKFYDRGFTVQIPLTSDVATKLFL